MLVGFVLEWDCVLYDFLTVKVCLGFDYVGWVGHLGCGFVVCVWIV